MGLLLSVLIVCVGVFEALDCYYHFRAGLLPPQRLAGNTAGNAGWRHQLAALNERWRRRSSALTCGGGAGGASGDPGASWAPLGGSAAGAAPPPGSSAHLQEWAPSPTATTPSAGGAHCQPNGHRPTPPRGLNNHLEDTLGNGGDEAPACRTPEESSRASLNLAAREKGAAADLKASSSDLGSREPAASYPALVADGPRLVQPVDSRRRSSSLDRPLTVSGDDGSDIVFDDPYAADMPRRLSEAFPEMDDMPAPTTELLKLEVDLPRRLSELEADVPSPLPTPGADLPRRLSDFTVPNPAPPAPPAAVVNPEKPRPRPLSSRGSTASPQSPRRISDPFSDSEPTSPSRKSKVDISWPTFTPVHPAHRPSLHRLEDLMSVDVEDDVFLPNNNATSKQDLLPVEKARPAQSTHPDRKPAVAKPAVYSMPNSEYKQLVDFLKFLDDHIHENDCMNLWHSIQEPERSEVSQGGSYKDVENPSKQYLELQEFLRRQYGDDDESIKEQTGPKKSEAPRDSHLSSDVESQAADRKKLYSPSLNYGSNESKREYMDFLNFLFLLRAQEENPEEPLLDEYFKTKAESDFKASPAEPIPNERTNQFQEYDELMQFLQSLPPSSSADNSSAGAKAAAPRSKTPKKPKSGHVTPYGQGDETDWSDLRPKTPAPPQSVVVSEEPESQLQRPARSNSFEAAPQDLSDSIIKAALEASQASASRCDDGEDEEVAAITAGLPAPPTPGQTPPASNGHGGALPPEEQSTTAPAAPAAPAVEEAETEGSSSQQAGGPQPQAPPTGQSGQPQPGSSGRQPEAFWLIFSGEYTKAMSKDWHTGHFCCWQCDESLTGQRYVLRDDHPYCIKCYESVFANTCEECSKTIGIDSKDLSYKDKHWHEACFLCSKCRVSLVDKQFGSKADHIYCGNCYDAQFASRCDGCGEIFRAGTKKMEYKTRQWHEKCFCCCVCKTAIGTKSFIPREQEIYCATCYEEKFATRCVKCNKIITSGGVTYKNEPWHRECFTCTHCNTSLAGQRFTSRDEKPYCADCFGELFAKRCTSCSKPITGIGGTRFISFEDRHWHNDCFICASCKTSLVGRGFITDADDIICPECAKQKLQ